MVEFHAYIRVLLQHMTVEEIHRLIIILEQFPFVLSRHRRQLLYVAYHQKLHASKCLVAATHFSQHCVDSIEEVGTHHTYLIDDEEVEATYYLQFRLAQLHVRQERQRLTIRDDRSEGQLEKRVYRHAARIDSCHPSRGYYHHSFITLES